MIGALRASSGHDGPHAFEPLSLTRISHYALADEEYRAEINDFAANRYPFKELTLAALDACLSAAELGKVWAQALSPCCSDLASIGPYLRVLRAPWLLRFRSAVA